MSLNAFLLVLRAPRALLLALMVALAPWGALAQGLLSGAPAQTVVQSDQARAELLAHAPQGATPGQPVWVGLQITHAPEWHTYWKNSGDSGLPTELQWTLPPGVSAGPIAWPTPRKFPIGNLANYGYDGTVVLPVPLTVTPEFKGSHIDVKLYAAWLVCRKECIPEEGEFTLQLPIQSTTALNGAAFEAAAKALPQPVLAGTNGIVPDSQAQIADGNLLNVSVQGLPVALRGKTLDLFPETAEVIDNAAQWKQAWNGSVWTAQIPLSAQRSASPSLMPVVLAEQSPAHATGPDTRTGYRAELKVLGTWPQGASVATVSPALEAALKANAAQAGGSATPAAASGASSLTLTAALLGALLGGLILNLMPCVFPVLAIKVVGFTQHAQDRRAHRVSGIAYTAGVVLSFIALGALMLGLRAAGEAVGWGFQLQSPAVVASLAALFTLIALNLAGVFEFGHFLPSSVASLQARHPVADSFLTGVLAVAVASPCTAPFMGASLGLTATLPAAQALAAGETESDTLTVTSADGGTSETITVTVTGGNGNAVITGDVSGAVVEDGVSVASGDLDIAVRVALEQFGRHQFVALRQRQQDKAEFTGLRQIQSGAQGHPVRCARQLGQHRHQHQFEQHRQCGQDQH